MNDRKLNEQQSRRDRADHEHGSGICGNELPDVPDRHRGEERRGTECGEQDQYDGESKPLLAPARRQRRQQDLLLVRRSRRSWRGRAGSRVAGGTVLSDRAELQVFRPASIALPMSFISVSLSNGLLRKPKAPAAMARARIRSSGKAVMKMMGMRRPCATSNFCSSTPLKPGICKSVIRQDVSSRRGDCRNFSADANVYAPKPSDVTRLLTAQRIDSSSSMIDMIGASCNCSSSVWGPSVAECPAAENPCAQHRYGTRADIRIISRY